MKKTLILWTFILIIPALIVAAHDLYVIYADTPEKLEKLEALDVDPNKFSFSDVGRLWIAYAPDSLNALRSLSSLSIWQNVIAPILQTKAVIVAFIPLVLFYLFAMISWVFGIGPFGHYSGTMKTPTRDKGKVQYTRK